MSDATRYSPIGKCIYCGSAEKLEDEHIVPFGLSGNKIVLPVSSCRSCATVTGSVEAKVLRGNFRGLRERFLLPSRSKSRPKKLPLFCINGDEQSKVLVDVEDYPITLILPTFGGPTIAAFPEMVGGDPPPWTRMLGWDFEKLQSKYGIESFATNSIDGWSFARMLAKIAHADAAARIGLEKFQPLLREFILAEDVVPSELIGTFATVEPAVGTDLTYQLSLVESTVDGVRYLCSRIRLFSNWGAPTYLVVVGRLPTEHGAVTS